MPGTICVTGHRPDKLGGYSRDVYFRLVSLATQCLLECRPDLIYTGMALGWDQAVAVACTRLDIPFHAAVPFDGQESMWPSASRQEYRTLLNYAKDVTVVSPGGYSLEAMQKRNEFMVDHSDTVLALWNGSKGGTRNCIHYAGYKKKKIINVYDRWRVSTL